jgi:hypothetical protein
MLVGAEAVSRFMFVESGAETCVDTKFRDPVAMKPNCVSHRKAAEGPPVENRYNDCGYRTPETCRPRRVGALRVAVMGASTAQGFKVPYPSTFAAKATGILTKACGRPVEFQSMGIAGASLVDIYRRTDEALSLEPDLIVLAIGPFDLKKPLDPRLLAERDAPSPLAADTIAGGQPNTPLAARLTDLVGSSSSMVAAQHYLFQDRRTFVRLYMLHGEDADFLRVPLSPAWQARLADLEILLTGMVTKAKAKNVPVLMISAPMRIQAALLSPDTAPPGVDPFMIGRSMAATAVRAGGLFADALETFAKVRSPESMFYAVDGHMSGEGASVFADALIARMRQSDIPAFAACEATGR